MKSILLPGIEIQSIRNIEYHREPPVTIRSTYPSNGRRDSNARCKKQIYDHKKDVSASNAVRKGIRNVKSPSRTGEKSTGDLQILSEAAYFNRLVLRKLQNAVDKNPEVDLLSKFPLNYTDRLKAKIGAHRHKEEPSEHTEPKTRRTTEDPDIRSVLDPTCLAEVIYPLSPPIKDIISAFEQSYDERELSRYMFNLLFRSEIIYKGPFPQKRTIFRCSPGTLVKVVSDADDYTEYTTLQFLDKHAPKIPAPKPLGLLRIGVLSLIFTSYIPGTTLETIWPHLTIDQKLSVKDQLGKVLTDLRSIKCPPSAPMGGVQGEGCKDLRRNIRRNSSPIFSVEHFDDFQFSNIRYGSRIFVEFLRKFTFESSCRVCFSHGDVRPANIMVQKIQDGQFEISGLLDWEFSGFYPEYFESTKATNCLSTDETSDWYNYLPSCLSPYTWPRRWLLDYVLGRHLE